MSLPVPRASILLAVLVALAAPAAGRADTVYFRQPGAARIASVSGTIVEESGSHVEVATADGNKVSIAKEDVFQIIRAESTPEGSSDFDPSAGRSFRGGSSGIAGHFGVKGGMNVSNLSVDPQSFEEEGSLRSYAVGAWWGLPLNRRVTFRTEALYSVKGDSESSGGFTTSTRMNYIDVPVLARIGFMHGAPAQPSLVLGPSLALNLSARSTFEGEGSDVVVDVKDQVRTFDVGFVLGGGVDFPLGGRTYGVELRYSKGLTNAVGENANGSAHNDVLAVMGSIGFQ